jgi:hypothetical protein
MTRSQMIHQVDASDATSALQRNDPISKQPLSTPRLDKGRLFSRRNIRSSP